MDFQARLDTLPYALKIFCFIIISYVSVYCPGGSDGRDCLQCGRPRFDPWIGKMPWRRKWQPTPVFLPEEFHGRRSLVGYDPSGHKESDTTERLTLSQPPGNDQTAELPCSSLYLQRPPAESLCVHYLNENDAKEQEGQAYLFLPGV